MLPQIKRPARSDDGDVEIEVVDVRNVDGSELSDDDPTMLAQNTLFPKGSKGTNSTRPPASSAKANINLGNLTNSKERVNKKAAAAFGDEPTRLMPSKHGGKSSVLPPAPPSSVPPPASTRAQSSRPPASQSVRPGALPPASIPPAPLPNSAMGKSSHANQALANPGTAAEFRPPPVPSRSRPAPPPAFRDREESHTMLRPLGALTDLAQNEPKVSIAVPSAGAIKAQVDAARAKRMADQKARAAETLEVTPVSISERFVVQGRPAAPWAVAFVAMGIFAGLATAVFTGGHASSIASFIDPGRLGIAAAAAQPAAPPAAPVAAQPASDPALNMGTTAAATPTPAAVDPALALAPTTPTNVFAVGRAAAKTTDTPAPTPVAHTAPKPTPVAKADPPASKPDPAPVAKADPKPTPVADSKPSDSSSSHSSKPSKSTKHGGGDVDSAAAADALAKAQLENSL